MMYVITSAAAANMPIDTRMRLRSPLPACHKSSARIASIIGGSISPKRRIFIAKPTTMPHNRNAPSVSRRKARCVKYRTINSIAAKGTSFTLKNECAYKRGCSRNISIASSAIQRLPSMR